MNEQLNNCLADRRRAADELQNEVNQILASALLWIRFAKTENKLADNEAMTNAETNVALAIEHIRRLHYSLSEEII